MSHVAQRSQHSSSPRARAHGVIDPRHYKAGPSSLTKQLIESKKTSSPRSSLKEEPHDFSSLLSLFRRPVYGESELIVRKYLSYMESREECAQVGTVWKCDDSVYMDYMNVPFLPHRRHGDWLFSSVFYVALDDEADVFPEKLRKVLSAIVETRNNSVFSCYSQALRVLHCLHVELRCPHALHAKFWKAHAAASSGNFASLISRITRLAEARLCLLDIFKFVTGYPSHSTQIRLQRIHEVLAAACNRKDSSESEIERYLPDLSVSQPLSVNPEDLYSPIKPRSDSLLGQTAQQIRKRARETVIQGNKTEYFSTISTNEHSHRAVKPISATPPVTCAHEAQSSANSFPFRGGNSLEMVAEDDESDCTCDSILESSQISSCITNFNSNKDLIKTVVRHNINSESKQVMGYDTIAYETDADLTLGKGIEDNVKAIEGALRRFTELDRMFSTATVELEQRVFIKTAQTEVKDRKGAVIRILIAEFIESLPWKVEEFLLLGQNWRG